MDAVVNGAITAAVGPRTRAARRIGFRAGAYTRGQCQRHAVDESLPLPARNAGEQILDNFVTDLAPAIEPLPPPPGHMQRHAPAGRRAPAQQILTGQAIDKAHRPGLRQADAGAKPVHRATVVAGDQGQRRQLPRIQLRVLHALPQPVLCGHNPRGHHISIMHDSCISQHPAP